MSLFRANTDKLFCDGIQTAGFENLSRIWCDGIESAGISYVSLTTEYNGTFSVTLKGASGSVFFDWGGGEYEEFVLTTGGVACTHVYSDASSKEIKIYGALSSVTSLDTRSMVVTSIFQFDGLTSLTYLNFYDNSIVDISSLSGLTDLTTLYLYNNSIVDISPLAGLTKLTNLRLYNNSIVDISPLVGLTGLTTFSIQGNSIVDISPLAGLTNLATLYIQDNSIVDISPLVGLVNLTNLRVYTNPVTYPPAGITWPAWDGSEYRLDSTVTTNTEVDQTLIDFAAGGMNNCLLNVAGTNPVRTSASDAAMGTLITNNVTVTVNT